MTDRCTHYSRFAAWAAEKHLHVISIWRRLDRDGSMTVMRTEFAKGIKELGFQGDVDKLWWSFDRDHTGTITFNEFCPEQAIEIARFKHWIEGKFGSIKDAFKKMDVDRNGLVTFKEFSQVCIEHGIPSRLRDSLRLLFILVDYDCSHQKGALSSQELEFLDVWKCPEYLTADPNLCARSRFHGALVRKYDLNPLKAWRVLDKDGSMRVCYDEFVIICKELAKRGMEQAAPPGGIAGLYVALDRDRSGWFTLRDWDKCTHRLLFNFLTFCRSEHSKVSSATASWEDIPGEGLTKGGLRRGLRPMTLCCDDREMLWGGLASKRKTVTGRPIERIWPYDMTFLDHWDPKQELEDDIVYEQMAMKRQSLLGDEAKRRSDVGCA